MNCSYLNETHNLRLFLHDKIYVLQNIIEDFYNCIEETTKVFNINYTPCTKSFNVKIKKTDMKKRYGNYIHTNNYYYGITNGIFINVFNKNKQLIESLFNKYKDSYNLNGTELKYLYNKDVVFGLYNITTLLDNIFVITL